MMQFTLASFIAITALLICIGVLIGALVFALTDDADEERQAKERQSYIDALIQLNSGSLNARQDLIASALENMKNEQKH